MNSQDLQKSAWPRWNHLIKRHIWRRTPNEVSTSLKDPVWGAAFNQPRVNYLWQPRCVHESCC